MDILEFHIKNMITHNWCGKFESPSPEWMHLTRDLTDFELILVTSGTLYIGNSSHHYTVQAGEYLLMYPDSFQHGVKQSDCSFYWMHFWLSADLWKLLHSKQDIHQESDYIYIPVSGKAAFPERILVLLKQLQDSDKRHHNPCLNNALATSALLELYSQISFSAKPQLHERQNQTYHDMMDFIRYHACEKIQVRDVAEYFGYNEKYLSTLFRKHSGMSLKQFMLQAKMDVAKAELRDTNHSVSQIAYNVGFHDTHNFTNAFKKVTGLSPSAYRESYEKRALFHQ